MPRSTCLAAAGAPFSYRAYRIYSGTTRTVITCGHLDAYANNPGVAPGADDNGSGSTAVLEAARVMSPYTFRNTVRFSLFGAEEIGGGYNPYYH